MKLMVIFGTRPEIIRLSVIIKRLDQHCEQVLVHTGQNFDTNLSDIFFEELGLRRPDFHLGITETSFASQAGMILKKTGDLMAETKPDRLLLLGDTNSGLSSIAAARAGIPVFHMEAGNRCYDDRVPEEINRRVIDHCSDVLMPYTRRSKENLVREGVDRRRIYVIGNPIYEVLRANESRIDSSRVLEKYSVELEGYFLATLHRAENVDEPGRLQQLLKGLMAAAGRYGKTVVMSLHPRTADKMARFDLEADDSLVRITEPMGFADFVKLEKDAFCVLTDSGTVQEECCILRTPNVTIRDVTERPETIEAGSNILAGADPDMILSSVEISLGGGRSWNPPPEYLDAMVSTKVAKIVLGFQGSGN